MADSDQVRIKVVSTEHPDVVRLEYVISGSNQDERKRGATAIKVAVDGLLDDTSHRS